MGGLIHSVSNLFGGADNNAGFSAQGANIAGPATVDQANQLYGQAQSGISQQQALANALAAQNGIQNQSQVVNQLQGVVNGTGPNPANAMLNQATGQNVANQAALMAGQRGAGANTGLLARQAAQQGANTQQQAVGQGATLQAQQGLNALGQLGNLTSQQVAQQQAGLMGLNQMVQGEQGQILGGIDAQNRANIGNIASQNAANSGIAQTNANNTAQGIGGLMKGATRGLLEFSRGGEVENPKLARVPERHRFEDHLYPSHIKEMNDFYHGQSYGEAGSFPKYAEGGNVGSSLKEGGKVPGKAQVKGDSEKNDTVKAKLSPGEVVLPRSVMNSDDPASAAAKFVAALKNKKSEMGHDEGGEEGDFKSALKRAIKGRKSK